MCHRIPEGAYPPPALCQGITGRSRSVSPHPPRPSIPLDALGRLPGLRFGTSAAECGSSRFARQQQHQPVNRPHVYQIPTDWVQQHNRRRTRHFADFRSRQRMITRTGIPETQSPKFAGHETFSLRYGWPKKAVDATAADPLVFTRDEAVITLGVGKNMVRSIRHWGLMTGILEEDPRAAEQSRPSHPPFRPGGVAVRGQGAGSVSRRARDVVVAPLEPGQSSGRADDLVLGFQPFSGGGIHQGKADRLAAGHRPAGGLDASCREFLEARRGLLHSHLRPVAGDQDRWCWRTRWIRPWRNWG